MKIVYDIETFKNCFTYTGLNIDTKEMDIFVIGDDNLGSDLEAFRDYMNNLNDKKAGMIGFNNVHFDWPIVRAIMLGELLTAKQIYAYAQEIISQEKRSYTPQEIMQLDLYLLNHYDNKSRNTSLKALEVSCGWDNVMDMPFDHTTLVDKTKLEQVIKYNKNDVEFTAYFYELCNDKVELRKKIGKKYNLKVLNKSDVVIGESIFLKYLSEAMRIPIRQLTEIRGKRADVPLKKIILPNVKFETPEFNKLLGLMNETVSSSSFLKKFVENIDTTKSTNELFEKFRDNNIRVQRIAQQKKSFSFSVNFGGMRLDYGVGGIHGCMPPGVYLSSKTYKILDIDVKSYYPNLFIQNKLHPRQMNQDTFVKVYSDIFDERVKAQLEKDKLTSDALKLALNGMFGKTGSDVSCFYDPFVFYAITVNGQLFISMLVERLVAAGAELLQVNTDGVTVSVPRKNEEQILAVCKKWEQETRLTLEYADYAKMIIRDVNNYIAVGEDGKIKEKGAFETKKDWHKDNSYMVVPMAVREYFVNGTPISETLRKHENILDFCGRYKATKGWHVEYVYLDGNEEKRLNFGKIYRFLPVNRGGVSLKINKDGREHQLCEGYQTYPFNTKDEFDKSNLNYGFFENECRKLIELIQPKQLTLL
ncbi:MAG: hypothetical protein EBR30_09105 [Cytophagia bacterium]|nr:hypothetical protein [Cytophagia bacterium]NBW35160.1 hypothetical protein [Cytophagia bacterium]